MLLASCDEHGRPLLSLVPHKLHTGTAILPPSRLKPFPLPDVQRAASGSRVLSFQSLSYQSLLSLAGVLPERPRLAGSEDVFWALPASQINPSCSIFKLLSWEQGLSLPPEFPVFPLCVAQLTANGKMDHLRAPRASLLHAPHITTGGHALFTAYFHDMSLRSVCLGLSNSLFRTFLDFCL